MKTKRGHVIKKTEGWRGTCPLCKRTGVRLLWTKGESKCCKKCAASPSPSANASA